MANILNCHTPAGLGALGTASSLSGSIAENEIYREGGGREIFVVPTALSSSSSSTAAQSSSLDSFDAQPAGKHATSNLNSASKSKLGSSSSSSKGNNNKRKSFDPTESPNNENYEPNSLIVQDPLVDTSAKKLRFKEALTGSLLQANMCLPPSSAPAISSSQTFMSSISTTSTISKVPSGRSALPRFNHQTRSQTTHSNKTNLGASVNLSNGNNSRISAQTPQSDKKRIVRVTEQNTAERAVMTSTVVTLGSNSQGTPHGSSGSAVGAVTTTPKRKNKFFFSNPQTQHNNGQNSSQQHGEAKDSDSPFVQNSATKLGSNYSTVSNALIRRLRKNVVKSPSSEIVRGFFDTAFSVTEDKVNSILSNLKVKSKWDYKEKSKKQEVVIKELRESVATLLAEVKDLRDNCLAHEGHVSMLLRDSLDEVPPFTH